MTVRCVFLTILALALLTTSGGAQQQAQPIFRASTRLIVQTVSVLDRDGKPVEGLTANDFVVTEDGQAQDIAFIEYQRLDAPAAAAAGRHARDGATGAHQPRARCGHTGCSRAHRCAGTARASATATAAVDVPSVQTGFASRTPGDDRFQNRRLLIFYFDLTATAPPDQMRAYDAALKYIDGQMQPVDMMAIMTFGGGSVRIKQDFTDNRATLREVMYLMIYGKDEDGDGVRDPEIEGTEFGQNDAEFNVFSTDRQLAALQTAVTMLRPFPEQKSLIYFASNLRLNGTDNNAQLRATTNAAIRANVQLFPVDARGLVASAPLGDATQRSPGGIGMFSGALAQAAIVALPAVAGHALRARQGHRRQGDVRLQRPVARHRPGGAGADELLHHRLLQHAHRQRRQVPPRPDHAGRRPRGASSPTGRATTPTRNSRRCRPPSASASSRKRSCSRIRSPTSPSRSS